MQTAVGLVEYLVVQPCFLRHGRRRPCEPVWAPQILDERFMRHVISLCVGAAFGAILVCVIAYFVFENTPVTGTGVGRGMNLIYGYLPIGFIAGWFLGGVAAVIGSWTLFRKRADE